MELFIDELGRLRMKHDAFFRPVVVVGHDANGFVFHTAYHWGHA